MEGPPRKEIGVGIVINDNIYLAEQLVKGAASAGQMFDRSELQVQLQRRPSDDGLPKSITAKIYQRTQWEWKSKL